MAKGRVRHGVVFSFATGLYASVGFLNAPRARTRITLGPGMRLPARLAVLLGLLGSLASCGVGYIVQQGMGQLGMLGQREPIARVLQERNLPVKTRDRLVLLWHARRFAGDVLGLHTGQSYQD